MNTDQMMEQFKKDREEALLSLDLDKIRAYMRKYGIPIPGDELVLWGSIHKARTALKDLPIEARRESKRWLDAQGYHSLDDGDLS